MNILIASDHAGFKLKSHLIDNFQSKYNFTDLGCFENHVIDYPDIAKDLCNRFLDIPRKYDFGILICGTGIGVSIVANRFPDIRAALCSDPQTSKLARNHNNANILCFGGRVIDNNIASECFQTFVSSEFLSGRHLTRINKI